MNANTATAQAQRRGVWNRVLHPRLKGWPLLVYAAAICVAVLVAYVMLCLALGWKHLGGYIPFGLFCLVLGKTWFTITGRSFMGLEKG